MTAHVVVAVPNDIVVDTRSQKFAIALRELGYRVTLLGIGPSSSTSTIADVPMQVVGVGTRLRRTVGERQGKLPKETIAMRKDWLALERLRQQAAVGRTVGRAADGSGLASVASMVERAGLTADRTARTIGRKATLVPTVVKRKALTAAASRRDGWRELLPEIHDIELAVGPVLDKLAADIIIPDVYLLGIAVGSAERARAKGRRCAVFYDAREFVGGLASEDPKVLKGFPSLEAEFIGRADAVCTVSPPIADFLQERYDLAQTPPLILNAPYREIPPVPTAPSLRRTVGLAEDVPLLVYGGGLNHFRGAQTIVEALPQLPGVHLALVAKAPSHYTRELEELAESLDCRDRLHFAPYAPAHEVHEYLSSATVSVIPFLPVGNHEWAAPNKYFESMQAGLPIVTSDVAVQVEMTTRLGNGEVFGSGDAAALATAVRAVLADRERYTAAYTPQVLHEHSWEGQVPTLAAICRSLITEEQAAGLVPTTEAEHAGRFRVLRQQMAGLRGSLQLSAIESAPVRLCIGPKNSAGQAYAWAQALRMHRPEALVESLWIEREGFDFPADRIATAGQWHNPGWQVGQLGYVTGMTHVLAESGSSVIGALFGPWFTDEMDFLRRRGIVQGVLFHGSDIRNPAAHAEREPASPFADAEDELTAILQASTAAMARRLATFDGPRFVSTPDLLLDVPDATWLPVVVDAQEWATSQPAFGTEQRRAKPRVVHLSSNSQLKASEAVDAAVKALHEQGRIDYELVTGVSHSEAKAAVRDADIVLDQFALGSYGTAACEAMAAGRLVIGHVSEQVRAVATGLPIVEATTEQLPDVLVEVISRPADYAAIAASGQDFVARWHDGTASANVLADFVSTSLEGELV